MLRDGAQSDAPTDQSGGLNNRKNQRPETYPVHFENHKMTGQTVFVFFNQSFQTRQFQVSFLNVDTYENDAVGRFFQSVNEVAKIFIFSQQNAAANKSVL